jgi:hypothetical protein
MMKKLSAFFYKLSTRMVALAGLLIFLVFSAVTLPGQSALTEKYSHGLGAPDTTLFYSGQQLYSMAEAYGETGRQAFLHARWTFDLAFPLIYTFFLVTSSSLLLRKLTPAKSNWRLLNLLPLAAFVLDLLENSATSLVMHYFPTKIGLAQGLAPVVTPLKWLAVGLSFMVLILSVSLNLIRQFRKKNPTS